MGTLGTQIWPRHPVRQALPDQLSVVLGNGITEDTNHYVDVEVALKNRSFAAKLHLLELPGSFDVIVGLDWLGKYDGYARVRGRSLELTPPVGKRIIVAGYGTVSSGLPSRGENIDWTTIESNLCFLHPITDGKRDHRGGDIEHAVTWAEDVSEIEVVETPKLEDLRAKHANDDHAFMLMALLERSGTKSLGEFSEMMREPDILPGS